MERRTIKMESGDVLQEFHDGETRVFGILGMRADGTAVIWKQVWTDSYRPTGIVYPGPISAMRAMRRGEV